MSSYFQFGNLFSRTKRIAILFILIFLASGTARMVLAHSEVDRTDPEDGQVLSQSPQEVRAWFSEELDSQSSKIRVFDAQNHQIDHDDGGVDLNDMDHKSMLVNLPPSLPQGTYTVHWEAASADDGDLTEGAFYFTVGTPGGATDPAGQPPASINIPLAMGIAAVLLLLAWVAFVITRRRTSNE